MPDALAPTTLAPGQTVDVPVRFSPTTPGRHSVELGNAGAINVVTDMMGQSYVISLVGNATTPPATAGEGTGGGTKLCCRKSMSCWWKPLERL